VSESNETTPAYVVQLATAYRFLERFKAVKRFKLESENKINDHFDFLEATFQSCWHVKDWIRNDAKLDQAVREKIWKDVQRAEPLLIVADLANGTKHLVVDPKLEWVGAGAGSTEITRNADGTSTLTTQILLKDGRRLTDLEVIENAMKAWQDVLKRNDMLYFRDPTEDAA